MGRARARRLQLKDCRVCEDLLDDASAESGREFPSHQSNPTTVVILIKLSLKSVNELGTWKSTL